MTKADIVNEISKQTGVEKAQVQQIVEAFMESVKNALIENKDKKGKDRGVFLRALGEGCAARRKAQCRGRRADGPAGAEKMITRQIRILC